MINIYFYFIISELSLFCQRLNELRLYYNILWERVIGHDDSLFIIYHGFAGLGEIFGFWKMNFYRVNPRRFPAVVFLASHIICYDHERKNIHENNRPSLRDIGRIILFLPTEIAPSYSMRYTYVIYVYIILYYSVIWGQL